MMSTRRKDPGPARLAERETEVKELKREIETLRREKAELREENAELREENDKLKQSLDEDAELREENAELREENDKLKQSLDENAELREENDKLKQSLDEAIRSSKPPVPARRGLRPSNSEFGATSATADTGTDSELLNRRIQQLSETRQLLSYVQSRLTINEQVTAATQRRQLIQEGAYENLPKNTVYEELRFDPSQEPVYTKLQPTHIGCSNVLLVPSLQYL